MNLGVGNVVIFAILTIANYGTPDIKFTWFDEEALYSATADSYSTSFNSYTVVKTAIPTGSGSALKCYRITARNANYDSYNFDVLTSSTFSGTSSFADINTFLASTTPKTITNGSVMVNGGSDYAGYIYNATGNSGGTGDKLVINWYSMTDSQSKQELFDSTNTASITEVF